MHTLLLASLEFTLDNGYLKHTLSGKCVKPTGAVTHGIALGLYSTCDGHQFSFTAGGSLQHIASRKCVNTKSGVSEQFIRHVFPRALFISLDSHHHAYFLLIFFFVVPVLFCFVLFLYRQNSRYVTNAAILDSCTIQCYTIL